LSAATAGALQAPSITVDEAASEEEVFSLSEYSSDAEHSDTAEQPPAQTGSVQDSDVTVRYETV